MELAQRIDELWESGELDPDAIEEAIALLDRGEARVAEKRDGEWVVNEWAKKAILLYFRLRKVEPMDVGGLHFLDKIPVKDDYAEHGVRVVPPGVARYGSFLSEGVVLMPGFVNIGAWVGPRTMVDTWATVGSCAQIGADVHLAGGVGIGGVLEPPQARPVIVEDGAFLGSRAVVVEGVVVGKEAVIAPNVVLAASIPIIDVTGSEPVEHRGYVPPRSVVLPGSRPKEYPAGTLPASLRAHRGRAERLDGPEDVAQRRLARVRDRDMSEIVEIALFTADVEAAKAFYGDLLTAEPEAEWPGGAIFAAGSAKLLVHERARRPRGTGRPTRITSRSGYRLWTTPVVSSRGAALRSSSVRATIRGGAPRTSATRTGASSSSVRPRCLIDNSRRAG